MIHHIRIFNHKGVDELHLNNLGQINILCGKNSSGKSSILECLANKEKLSVGVQIDNDLQQVLRARFDDQVVQQRHVNPSDAVEWFRICLHEHVEKQPVWYLDQINSLKASFEAHIQKWPFFKVAGGYFALEPLLRHPFEEIKTLTTALIPPKRRYDAKAPIDFRQKLQPNGDGVINRLFFLKNAPLQSSEFKTFKKIDRTFRDLTSCSFNIVPNEQNHLSLYIQVSENWVDAESCGLGLKDLLFLVTYVQSTDYNLYLIEEPESHLHPELQKRFLRHLKTESEKQFILSTHSNSFLDSDLSHSIYYCWYDNKVNLSNSTTLSKIANDLGLSVTENLSADAIILTEGPTDIPIVKQVLHLCGITDRYLIKYWPLGGDIMLELDLSLFSNNKFVFAIIDSDPGSSKIRTAFQSKCKDEGVNCHKLERYGIENYLPLNLIKEAFPNQIDSAITDLHPNKSVDEQTGLKAKNRSVKGKNHIIAKRLEQKDIDSTDLWTFAIGLRDALNSVKKN